MQKILLAITDHLTFAIEQQANEEKRCQDLDRPQDALVKFNQLVAGLRKLRDDAESLLKL